LNENLKRSARPAKSVIQALVAGLLLDISIFLLLFDRPTDFLGLLTDISVYTSFDDRALKYPLAAISLCLFVWTSVSLYRSRAMSPFKQCSLLLLALAAGGIWFFTTLSRIRFSFW
jgi:hypothetical protein